MFVTMKKEQLGIQKEFTVSVFQKGKVTCKEAEKKGVFLRDRSWDGLLAKGKGGHS